MRRRRQPVEILEVLLETWITWVGTSASLSAVSGKPLITRFHGGLGKDLLSTTGKVVFEGHGSRVHLRSGASVKLSIVLVKFILGLRVDAQELVGVHLELGVFS